MKAPKRPNALLLKKNNLTFGDCFVYLNFFWGGCYTHEIFWKKRSGKVLVLPAQNGRLER